MFTILPEGAPEALMNRSGILRRRDHINFVWGDFGVEFRSRGGKVGIGRPEATLLTFPPLNGLAFSPSVLGDSGTSTLRASAFGLHKFGI